MPCANWGRGIAASRCLTGLGKWMPASTTRGGRICGDPLRRGGVRRFLGVLPTRGMPTGCRRGRAACGGSFNNQRMTGESQLVNLITSEPRYGATGGFRERLEGGPHGSPHVFVGGIMSTFLSPEDPVFFLHHANVDRLWAIWQDCHDHDKIHSDDIGDATYERSSWWPTGGWIDANMPYSLFFWEDSGRFGRVRGTPRDMHSISSPRLGYRYADDDALVRLPTMQSGCTGDWAWFHTTSTSGRNMKTQGVDFGYHLGCC
eukprot:Sspe_Gene.28783::Locus_13226_Transcript_1_2_Confidence_0.800_Length_1535::g.28783::m.28783